MIQVNFFQSGYCRTQRIVAVAAAMLACWGGAVACGNDHGPFAEAVEYAQRRTVKVYGASIGRVSGFASGIIVSDDGQIITTQGVHLSAYQLRVTLPDGTTHRAKVVKRSDSLQLALLKIEASTPDFYPLAKTPSYEQGDWIIAVSNAFKVADGAEPLSVNLGVVSLRTKLEVRRGVQDFDYDGDVLLIDAITSNPGAAGGAIVTADRELAGMVGKVLESTSTNTRLNYAVPADLIAGFVSGESSPAVASTSEDKGKATLGIRLFRLGGRRGPAYVDRISSGGPASQAKLQRDDLIVSLDGKPIKNSGDYNEVMEALVPGNEVTIVVKRRQRLLSIQITPAKEEE